MKLILVGLLILFSLTTYTQYFTETYKYVDESSIT